MLSGRGPDRHVQPSHDAIRIALQALPGTTFDPAQIAACLDHTVDRTDTGQR